MSDLIEKVMGDLVSRKAVIVMIHEHFQHRIDELPVIETEDGEAYDMKSIDAILKDSKALCEVIKAMPYGYSEDEIHRAEKMEQAQLDEVERLARIDERGKFLKKFTWCNGCIYASDKCDKDVRIHCILHDTHMKPSDFCSYGRKEKGEDNALR